MKVFELKNTEDANFLVGAKITGIYIEPANPLCTSLMIRTDKGDITLGLECNEEFFESYNTITITELTEKKG